MNAVDRRQQVLTWAYCLAALYWADLALTAWALLHRGAVEQNPVANALVAASGLWALALPKVAFTALLFLATLRVRPSLVLPWLQGLTIAALLLTLWNITQVWQAS